MLQVKYKEFRNIVIVIMNLVITVLSVLYGSSVLRQSYLIRLFGVGTVSVVSIILHRGKSVAKLRALLSRPPF